VDWVLVDLAPSAFLLRLSDIYFQPFFPPIDFQSATTEASRVQPRALLALGRNIVPNPALTVHQKGLVLLCSIRVESSLHNSGDLNRARPLACCAPRLGSGCTPHPLVQANSFLIFGFSFSFKPCTIDIHIRETYQYGIKKKRKKNEMGSKSIDSLESIQYPRMCLIRPRPRILKIPLGNQCLTLPVRQELANSTTPHPVSQNNQLRCLHVRFQLDACLNLSRVDGSRHDHAYVGLL